MFEGFIPQTLGLGVLLVLAVFVFFRRPSRPLSNTTRLVGSLGAALLFSLSIFQNQPDKILAVIGSLVVFAVLGGAFWKVRRQSLATEASSENSHPSQTSRDANVG